MKKKSALALAMTGGLEVVMTPWAGVAPMIEAMRQIEVTDKADKVLPSKRSSKGLTSGQMLGYAIPAPEMARQWRDRFHDEEEAQAGEFPAAGDCRVGWFGGSESSCGKGLCPEREGGEANYSGHRCSPGRDRQGRGTLLL